MSILLAGGLAACGGGNPSNAVMTATPATGLPDEARTIVISHLDPSQLVTVSARSVLPDGVWTASATFRADVHGVVNLARQAPIAGSYRGISPMGLFWSAHRAAGSAASNTTVTALTARTGARRVASARVIQILTGPGVTTHRETMPQTGFVGDYFAPAGATGRPAVVVWGGSEGGMSETVRWASLLASHDIPALALAYFDEPGLPCALSDIPLEYFAHAIGWLRRRRGIDPARVWLLSASRGSEAALLVAEHWPGLAHGVVLGAPSSIGYAAYPGRCMPTRPAAWTLHGRPVPYDDLIIRGAVTTNPDGSISEVGAFADGLGLPSANRARIPLSHIRGPALLISGGDDQLWPSSTYAAQIMAGLRSDRTTHRHVNYPGAGHVAFGIPYARPVLEIRGARGALIDLGGTAAANEAAHERAWPATIDFITRR